MSQYDAEQTAPETAYNPAPDREPAVYGDAKIDAIRAAFAAQSGHAAPAPRTAEPPVVEAAAFVARAVAARRGLAKTVASGYAEELAAEAERLGAAEELIRQAVADLRRAAALIQGDHDTTTLEMPLGQLDLEATSVGLRRRDIAGRAKRAAERVTRAA